MRLTSYYFDNSCHTQIDEKLKKYPLSITLTYLPTYLHTYLPTHLPTYLYRL